MTKKCWLALALMVLGPLWGMAQEVLPEVWQQYIELLTDEGEDEAVDELLELYELYAESPANLNDTADLLSAFPFVSDVQRERLRAYVRMSGRVLSIEELYAINGFDSTTVELLRPVVMATPCGELQTLTWRDLWTKGRSNMVMGTGGTMEKARGYKEDKYEGNDMRLMWRYRYKCGDRVQLQLSADKDPGEALFSGSQKQGFDFYGYSLLINDLGRWTRDGKQRQGVYVKRLAVGQYHLQFGQGLTLWSGFGPRTTVGTGIGRYAQGIRPNGAFTEYGFLHGGAATVALGESWNTTLFLSYRDCDATLPRSAGSDADHVQSLYNSGYHRTETERNKKGQLGELLYGGRLEYRTGGLRVGMTGAVTRLDKAIIPLKNVYNDNYFSGDNNANVGVDFVYRASRLLWFGEAAVCANRALDTVAMNVSPAVLAGAEFFINNNHRVSVLLRYYSPTYHNLHANAAGQGSAPQNELGATICYQGRLPWGVEAALTGDMFFFPHAKYLVYAPSRGYDCRRVLSKASAWVKGLSCRVRYRFKTRGRNVTPSQMVDGAYLLEQTYRHQVLADVEYKTGPWRLVSRVGYAHYHGDVTEADRGLLFYQDVQYCPSALPLMVAARVALFDVDDYEARLYAAESDFIYQYSGALYQNEGCRVYLLLRYDITPNWNIGFKYGLTVYTDKETFGSSYEQIDANHRQQWRIQMRLKW